MSLRIWLPLTGNLNNNGLEDITVSSTNATVDNNGKIGSCYSFNGNSSYLLGTHNFINNNTDDWSFCCWMKVNNAHTGCLFSCRNNVNYNGITIFYYGSQWIIDDGNRWQFTPTITIAANTWYHVCVVRKKGVGKFLYINGVLDSSTESVGTQTNVCPTYFSIGACQQGSPTSISGSWYNGYLNDIRFYDNALSVKEVKELAKGLVVHYPLNNNGYGIPNMVDHSDNFEGWTTATGWTKSISDDGSTIYSFSRTGATSNQWYRLIPTLQVDANDYPDGVTVSFDLYTPDKSAINQLCLGALQIYQSDNTRIGWREPNWDLTNVVNNKWCRIASYFTQAHMMQIYTSGAIYAYTKFSFQLVQNGNISIRRIKIEAGNKCTPYSLSISDINDNTIYDISGYNNHSDAVGSPTILDDSIRNIATTHFINGQYIVGKQNVGNYLPKDAMTVNLWVRFTGWSNPISCTEGGGWNFESGSNGIRFPVYINGVGYIYQETNVKPGTLVGSWHMLTGVFTGTSVLTYIDAELKTSVDTGSTNGIKYQTNYLFIAAEAAGNTRVPASSGYIGDISDVRIYATALSADDIKELYNIPVSLDNQGSLYGFELNENSGNTNISKTGLIESDNLYESHSLNQFEGSNDITFTPTTANNSTLQGWGKWFVPEGAVAGDTFRIRFNIEYENFDTSSTAGTFNIRFQGTNYTSPTTSVWAGINPICGTLNNTQSLKTLVLSAAKGSFVYETIFTLTQDFLDEYVGSNMSIRSDYSNGTAKLRITNTEIIPEKYSTTDNIKLKLGDDYISTNEFIEI